MQDALPRSAGFRTYHSWLSALLFSSALSLSSGAGCRESGFPDEPVCGDGTLDPGEMCDDGNTASGDGCESDCTLPTEDVFCKALDPLPDGVCEVSTGNGSRLLVGDVLAPGGILRGGEVLVDDTGLITCVGCDCASQDADATKIVCPSGVISPGLINSHDHITYTQNDPYTDTGERYEHRHDWRRGLNGHTEISSTGSATAEQIRWGELRFLIGGATSTVGSGSASGFLRNLDRAAQEGLGQTEVHYETFPLGDANGTQLAAGCSYPGIDQPADIVADDAYYPHISEGIDAFARNEFACVSGTTDGGSDLLEPKSAFIHSIGLLPSDYALMSGRGTSLIWSPRSNITLYGDTAVVTAAARLGVRIALGTDWMPTGSMNLQRELACADTLSRDYYGGFFSDRDLWRMVTLHGAQAAAVDDAVGALNPGLVADIAIFNGAEHPDYRAVIDAKAGDVALVLRGGTPLYGDDAVIAALSAGTCDSLDVCGTAKRVCAMDDIGQSLDELQAAVGNQYPLFFCELPDNEPSCTPRRMISVNGSSVYAGERTAEDSDGDGMANDADNCPEVFNPVRPVDNGAQADFDADGQGDACDVCPLDADTEDCLPFYDSDLDSDGVANDMDNCPRHGNPDQVDMDDDGKGDACDGCPMVANPGALACPVSIYDIKQGVAAGVVGVESALVTGCVEGTGYFVQVVPGDEAYLGAEYSGVYVYDPAVVCGTSLSVGDRVTLNPATVNNFFGQIQLTSAAVEVLSSGDPMPTPVAVASMDAAGAVATPLEAVLVRVDNVLVTEVEPAPGPGDSSPTYEFVVDDALRVDDLLYRSEPLPVVGSAYTSITGILAYRNGNSKLEPRDAADLVAGPPVLTGLAPATAYVREGAVAAPTIPVPLAVTLSSAVETDTFVSISSSDPASLVVVGGGVTVPVGANSAVVLVDALQPSPSVTLTATLDTQTRVADVRVVGAAEVPQVAAIDPAGAAVAPGGTVDLTVYLDIPATPVTGDSVSLTASPGVSGSVPASVTVAGDQISATFTFTANATEGAETITATLNGGMASASIDVTTGGGVIINEVNYDDPNLDTGEYIEILNVTGAPVDLGDLALVLVNGNNNSEYLRVSLAAASPLAPGEYLVIGTSTALMSVPPTAKTIAFANPDNNVQNGAPDGVAIVDLAAGTVVDALSYEGSITAGQINGVGVFDLVEGTATPAMDDNAMDGALIRDPNGTDTDDAASDWAFSTSKTPGEANVP